MVFFLKLPDARVFAMAIFVRKDQVDNPAPDLLVGHGIGWGYRSISTGR